MTREEAKEWFEDHIPTKIMPEAKRAYEMAVAALTPPTQEKMERVWMGCPYCQEDAEGYVRKFGAYSIHNWQLETGHCKPVGIKYCPHCGRAVTPAAWEEQAERLKNLID